MSENARKLTMCLVFLLFFSFVSQVVADDPVRIHAAIITASNQGNDFNLDNDAYRDQLIKLFSYSNYQQNANLSLDLIQGTETKTQLPDGYELVLNLQGKEEGRILVHAVIQKDNKQYVNTVLSILEQGVVFLGGAPVQGGELIIVLETGF